MTDTQRGLILLIKSALTGEAVMLPVTCNIEEIVRCGKKHKILPMLYYGILNSEINIPEEIKSFLEADTFKNILKDQKQLYQIDLVRKAFEDNGIDYMLLKGSKLKNLYPKTEMRLMNDADILIRVEQKGLASKVLAKLDFIEDTERKEDHDTVFNKRGELRLELHWYIVPPYSKDYFAYFGNGWRFASIEKEGKHSYLMSPEDNLVYIFAHFANHYRHVGIGVRHLVDFWVYLQRNPNLNEEYVYSCLEELKLKQFYINIRDTIGVWFEDGESTEMTDYITNQLFCFGEYKTKNARTVSSELQRLKWNETIGKHRWLIKAFPPYEVLHTPYPILRKSKLFLPFVWIFRIIRAVFFRRNSIRKQQEILKNISKEDIMSFEGELNYVGLNFDFRKGNTK